MLGHSGILSPPGYHQSVWLRMLFGHPKVYRTAFSLRRAKVTKRRISARLFCTFCACVCQNIEKSGGFCIGFGAPGFFRGSPHKDPHDSIK